MTDDWVRWMHDLSNRDAEALLRIHRIQTDPPMMTDQPIRRDRFRWDVDPTPIRDAVRNLHLSDADRAELTSDRTASKPSSGQPAEPPPTA